MNVSLVKIMNLSICWFGKRKGSSLMHDLRTITAVLCFLDTPWPFLNAVMSVLRFCKALNNYLFFQKKFAPLLSSLKRGVRAKRKVTKHKNLSAASSSVSSPVNNRTWTSSFLAANLKQTPRKSPASSVQIIYFVNLTRISASGQIASDFIYNAP